MENKIKLIPFQDVKEKWGYKNEKGEVVIEPQFDDAYDFSEDLAVVKVGDKFGYINKEGKFVIEPQFDDAYDFSEGLAIVKIGDKLIYINKEGKIVEEVVEKITNSLIDKIIKMIKEDQKLSYKKIVQFIDEDLNIEVLTEKHKRLIKNKVLDNEEIQRLTGIKNLSLRWFNFYVYVRIPLGILFSSIDIIYIIKFFNIIAFFISPIFLLLNLYLNLIDIILSLTLFIGLKNFKLWAWELNFVVLILEALCVSTISPLTKSFGLYGYFLTLCFIGLIWVLPNWIYFKKRKYLFS